MEGDSSLIEHLSAADEALLEAIETKATVVWQGPPFCTAWERCCTLSKLSTRCAHGVCGDDCHKGAQHTLFEAVIASDGVKAQPPRHHVGCRAFREFGSHRFLRVTLASNSTAGAKARTHTYMRLPAVSDPPSPSPARPVLQEGTARATHRHCNACSAFYAVAAN